MLDKKIKAWLERKYADDWQRGDDFTHYDNMVNMEWELPANMKNDWTRKRVSTIPYDVIKQLCNIFDTMNPHIEMRPRGPEDDKNAERLERWVDYELMQSNDYGETEWTRTALKHSGTYDEICLQVECAEDLPGDPDPEYPFHVNPFQPSVVHSDVGGGSPIRVGVINNVLASDVLEWWEPYNDDPDIKAKTDELRKSVEGEEGDNEQRVIYSDYCDKDRRYVFYQLTDDTTLPNELEFLDESVVLLDKKNSWGFVPWVIVKGSSGSILESLYKSGLVENQNFLDTLADSTIIRRAYFPLLKHTSSTGKQLDVNFTPEGAGVVEQGPQEDTAVLNPPPLDPGIRELMDRNAAKMNTTTGVQNLASTEAANVQFATVNALIELKKTELEPYKRNAEKAIAGVLKLFFKMAKKPTTAVRKADSTYGKKGEKIIVSPEDYDPKYVQVSCELMANDGSGKLQRANIYATIKKMGFPIPDSVLLELMGFDNPDVLIPKFQEQQIENAQLQAFVAEIMQAVQLKAQAAQMQMQMQVQQAQMQSQAQAQSQPQPGANPMQSGQNMPVNSNPMQEGFPGGEGFNPNSGGESPMAANPDATQTMMR